MHHRTLAVIFDMDGVIIDSEPLWRKAMIRGFTDFGVNFTEDDCRKTTGMRLNEVIKYWQKLHPEKLKDQEAVNHTIINYLINLINQEGKAMPGLIELLEFIRSNNIKIGLSTSSDHILIETILNKLEIAHYFHEVLSAQFLKFGKPHPEVYLTCAERLNIHPMDCMVIEDSINGIISGKAAQMNVIAIPDPEHINNVKFNIADAVVNHLNEVKDFIILN
ncbi:MAG: hexitol phosphatase HxpB [Sphingobacteriaceae bacterium]